MLDALVEARILAAVQRGDLDGLPGEGRPLQLDDDSMVPVELRMAYRILRNAGIAPAEVGLRHELSVLMSRLAGERDGEQRARTRDRLGKVIAYLEIAGALSPQTLDAYRDACTQAAGQSLDEPPEPPGFEGV